jgi:hypothetical protein
LSKRGSLTAAAGRFDVSSAMVGEGSVIDFVIEWFSA